MILVLDLVVRMCRVWVHQELDLVLVQVLELEFLVVRLQSHLEELRPLLVFRVSAYEYKCRVSVAR